MKVAGGLVKHLGLQMYSGATSSLSELVSNAWDAMATSVMIGIPCDRPLEPTDTIIVMDDGHGMTWEDCQKKFLVIGRDRRIEEGDLSEEHKDLPKRKVMSRKGLGKLAGFGIANIIEVKTIRNGEITHFSMSFRDIDKNQEDLSRYQPKMFSDDGQKTDEDSGTEVKLSELKITRAIPTTYFKKSLTRRFAVLSDPNFSVFLNDIEIEKKELEFEFRFPPDSGEWAQEDIEGAGSIKYWLGFTENSIKDDDARGIVVFCRGKLAQLPWTFDLPGGGYSSFGVQYLTGEVQADFLDATEGKDLIATDRGSVRWDEAPADALKSWGQKKLKETLTKWGKERTLKKHSRPIVKKYLLLGDKLPGKQRKIFYQYVSKLTSIPQLEKDDEILDELVKFGYNALTNQSFMEVIKQLNSIDDKGLDSVNELLSDWSVLEVITAAQIVKGRVEVINLFDRMIRSGAKEVPDLHDYLKKYPWLINQSWDTLDDERRMDLVIQEHFKVEPTELPDGKKRLDFFCKGSSGRLFIVEIKRADFKCTSPKELRQLEDYVDYMRSRERQNKDSEDRSRTVDGVLVAGDFSSNLTEIITRLNKDGFIVKRWTDLLNAAEKAHKEYFKLVRDRAPQDDPRIEELGEI